MKLASTEANLTDAIAEALSKQQILLETTVQKAIQVTMEDVKSSLIELRQEVQSQTNMVGDLISKVDNIQGETRQMKKDLNVYNRAAKPHLENCGVRTGLAVIMCIWWGQGWGVPKYM